jgi:hypothetical protein
MPATMAATTIQGLVPLAGAVVDGIVVDGTVVDGPDVVVVVGAGPDDAARKATTRSAEEASRSPAPTEGVGKWFAGAPIVARSWTAPEAGLRP